VNFSDTVRERADGSSTETGRGNKANRPGAPRVKELYTVEVWKDGVRESVVPITKSEVTIGRGSRRFTVDLPLKGDRK